MMDTKLRILRDGANRLVIVVDGASIEAQEAIIGRVSTAIVNPDAEAEATLYTPEEITGLKPVTQSDLPAPSEEDFKRMEPVVIGKPYIGVILTDGDFKGKTPYEVLDEHRYSALSTLYQMACRMEKSNPQRDAISKDCKDYMANRFRRDTQAVTSMDERKSLINAVMPMAPVDDLAKGYGFSSYKDLCRLGTAADLNNMFDAVVLSIEQRGRG